MLQIFCGNVKGKTSAAAGSAVRAAGAGMQVIFVQFLKDGSSSEISQLEKLGIKVMSDGCRKFVFHMSEEEKADLRKVQEGLLRAVEKELTEGSADMIILDEFAAAYRLGLLDRELASDLILSHKNKAELILTGRDPDPVFLENADYISQIEAVRHPYEKGIRARKGVEY